MNKIKIRELSKFASGLVFGDFLCGLWIYFSNLAPLSFLGVNFTSEQIILWLIFDVILFIVLINYGWKLSDQNKSDSERVFHNFVGILLTIVAILHLCRIIFGFEFSIGSWEVPYWLNALGTIVTGFLAYVSFHLSKKN